MSYRRKHFRFGIEKKLIVILDILEILEIFLKIHSFCCGFRGAPREEDGIKSLTFLL